MTQPRLGVLLLRAAIATPLCDYIEGDLEEELRARQDANLRWYWRQLLRSIAPVVALQVKRAEWELAASVILVASAGQLLAFDRLWAFVLSQIPLKADLLRGSDFFSAGIALTAICAVLAGAVCVIRALPVAAPAAMALVWGVSATLAAGGIL